MPSLKALVAGVPLLAVAFPASGIAKNALPELRTLDCEQLAGQAWAVKTEAWSRGAEALPGLQLEKGTQDVSKFELSLLEFLKAKDAFDVDENEAVSIEHPKSSNLYMASKEPGTLHCQRAAFVLAGGKGRPKLVDAPNGLYGEGDTCWTQTTGLGHVFGKLALVAHGHLNDQTFDEDIAIRPLIGSSWGPACTVRLRFRKTFELVGQICAKVDLCPAGKGAAIALAKAYDQYSSRSFKDLKLKFHYGDAPPKVALEAAERASISLSKTGVPPMPAEGAGIGWDDREYSYSYVDTQVFPLKLNGAWYVAVLGSKGIGWRQSGTTLLSVYAENRGALTPLAGFAVKQGNGGLIEASVVKP